MWVRKGRVLHNSQHNPDVHHTLQLAYTGLAAVTAFMTDVFGGYVDEVKYAIRFEPVEIVANHDAWSRG